MFRRVALLLIGLYLFPSVAQAASGTPLTYFAVDGSVIKTVIVDSSVHPGSLSATDLGYDGIAELVTGSAKGYEPYVTVVRQDGSVVGSFLAYNSNATMGVNVATCDTDGDGDQEIVTAPMKGGGPHIRIFDRTGQTMAAEFFVGSAASGNGTSISCSDVNGDGRGEIITGQADAGGTHIAIWDLTGKRLAEITPSTTAASSAFVTSGNLDDDAASEIAATVMIGSRQSIITYDFTDEKFVEKKRVAAPVTVALGETTIASFNKEVIFADGDDAKNFIEAMTSKKIFALKNSVSGDVAITPLHDKNTTALLSLVHTVPANVTLPAKKIVVDLSEQRLTTYTNGVAVKSFLISSGVSRMASPVGNFSVMAELPSHRYIGSNYDFKDVKWNLRFKTGYYIHTAYWHNNFGHPMSHGCINMREPDAKWVYDFAEVGTPVQIVN